MSSANLAQNIQPLNRQVSVSLFFSPIGPTELHKDKLEANGTMCKCIILTGYGRTPNYFL